MSRDGSQRRLTLAQLDALRMVIATSGVGEAARAMGVSQPVVSRLLRQAERGLGLSLLVRNRNRVVPTTQADAIRDSVDALFDAYESLRRLASSLRTAETGQVSIAAVHLQAARLVPPAIRLFKDEFPSVAVKLHVLHNRAVIGEVASEQADFGLVHSFTPAPELQLEDVGDQTVACIAPAGHRYQHLSVVGAEDMLDEQVVAYARYSTFHRWIEKSFEQLGRDVPVSIEVTSSHAMIELVRLGLGVGLLEGAAISPELRRELVVRPFSPELRLKSRILRPLGRPLSAHAKRLLEIYRDVALSNSQPISVGRGPAKTRGGS